MAILVERKIFHREKPNIYNLLHMEMREYHSIVHYLHYSSNNRKLDYIQFLSI